MPPSILVKGLPDRECLRESGFSLLLRNQCPACECKERTWILRTYDDRYGFPDEFDLVNCDACGTKYMLYYVDPEEMGELYKRYYASPNNARGAKRSRLHQKLRFVIRHSWIWNFVTAGQDLSQYTLTDEDVLDVGCGFGTNASSVLHRGGRWFGLDVDSKVVDYLNDNGFECAQGVLEEYVAKTERRFDRILLSQVIEHTPNPIAFMEAARKLLKPNGIVMLSCPNGQSRYQMKYAARWLHWHTPYHLSHFTPLGLTEAATKAGFNVAWLAVRTPPSWYLAQRLIQPTTLGVRNTTYDTKLEFLNWFAHSFYLRLLDIFFPRTGDAIVAQLSPR